MNKRIKISGKILSRYDEIISEKALEFVQEIHERFNETRMELLNERKKRQKLIDDGDKLDFLDETKKIRDASWKIKNIQLNFYFLFLYLFIVFLGTGPKCVCGFVPNFV